MKIGFWAFNTYLLLLAAAMLGCQSPAAKKDYSTLRMYIETNPDGTSHNEAVKIGRSDPFQVNIEKVPFITEYQVETASVIESMGGFQIMLQFNRQGSWLIEQYSLASREKRAVIMSSFPDPRWLAAPKLTRRIADGVLVFTPDCTREEADRIVLGLNNIVKQIKKGNK